MCLGIPGKIVQIFEQDGLLMGKVEFGGIVKEACLAYTPEVVLGDYVIVHVGFAISRVDEEEAGEIFHYLEEIGQFDAEDEHAATLAALAGEPEPEQDPRP